MNNKTIIGVLVGLLVIGGLAYWSLSGKEETSVLTPVEEATSTEPTAITVNHYFDKGTHTIEGTMTLPTPCHTLTTNATVAESAPEQVTVAFVTTPGTDICTQALADKFFRVSFYASKEAVISATLNGKPLRLDFSENFEGITK